MSTRAAGAFADERVVVRDEVHFRARAVGPDGRPFYMLIVNMSAMGLMARAEVPYDIDDRIHITLPVIGTVAARIRWSLGGRIGCELDRTIELAEYYDVLAVLLRSK